ncbi:MAG: GspE/PulE family protein [Candidatus Tectimicrobiota bacterium]
MSKYLEREHVCEVLYKQGLLTLEQVHNITLQDEREQRRVLTVRRPPGSGPALAAEATIVDLLVSLRLKLPDGSGNLLTEELIMRALAEHAHLPFYKIDPLKLDMEVVTSILPRAFALRYLVMPITVERHTLTIATADPWDLETLDHICKLTGLEVKTVVSPKSDILKAITEFYGFKMSVSAAERRQLDTQGELRNLEQYTKVRSVQDIQPNDRHIVNAVDFLFNYAFDQRASDIHIEPKRHHSLIRLRIDGVLNDIHRMPRIVHPAFVSRIKTLARLDIAEKRRPQDGRIKADYRGKQIELRISTMPVAFDEKIVMRIFDPDVLLQDLQHLGFSPKEYEDYTSFITQAHGIILITGPTGSGKTTTLYSTLERLSTSEVNITTIEDPIEMVHEQFNQVAVQPTVGVTFATALRTILRQDPDIIMVGEIRDYDTAEHAIHAALTGHLVLSTLHTNDAPSAIARLTDIGVQPYLIESTLIGVVAQRLMRKICPHCQEAYPPRPEEWSALGLQARAVEFKRGKGCVHCRNTGYLGRSGIYEIMRIDENVRELIRQNAGSGALQQAAKKAGMKTLRDSALRRVLEGVTTVEEALRVTSLH